MNSQHRADSGNRTIEEQKFYITELTLQAPTEVQQKHQCALPPENVYRPPSVLGTITVLTWIDGLLKRKKKRKRWALVEMNLSRRLDKSYSPPFASSSDFKLPIIPLRVEDLLRRETIKAALFVSPSVSPLKPRGLGCSSSDLPDINEQLKSLGCWCQIPFSRNKSISVCLQLTTNALLGPGFSVITFELGCSESSEQLKSFLFHSEVRGHVLFWESWWKGLRRRVRGRWWWGGEAFKVWNARELD